MADFGKIALTNAGINALVKVQAGSPLVFTKIKMGSGLYTGDVKTLTDLTETKLTAEIVKGSALSNAYMVEAHFTNEGLTAGFYWREIGLYFKDSNGNDALFGYANSGTTADYIPATASEIYSKHVRISVAVGDAANITVEHTTGTYVDIVTFEESLNEKVDKVEGKGLSTNDYSDEEKARVKSLEDDLAQAKRDFSVSVTAINTKLDDLASSDDLDAVKQDIENSLEDMTNAFNEALTEINERIDAINTREGASDLSGIGDGTYTGAIRELYNLISAMPTISSGTAEPSGGKDGDVYIMHEE